MNPEEKLSQPPSLLLPRIKAEEQIRAQIREAEHIRDINIDGWDALRGAKTGEAAWADYTAELLARMFSDQSEGDRFRKFREGLEDNSYTDFHNQGRYLSDRLNKSIAYLDSIVKRLLLIPEPAEAVETETPDSDGSLPTPENITRALELYEKPGPCTVMPNRSTSASRA